MQRPIKFRIWGKRNKRDNVMYLPMTIQEYCTGEFPGRDTDDCVFMQFTGLLDAKGKEIYEGDLLQDESGNIHTVDDPILGDFIYINHHEMGSGYVEEMKIIGNIYEQPELLHD